IDNSSTDVSKTRVSPPVHLFAFAFEFALLIVHTRIRPPQSLSCLLIRGLALLFFHRDNSGVCIFTLFAFTSSVLVVAWVLDFPRCGIEHVL
ncbi:hypothetical protein JAAARDRAFT_210482, partial [Jaapia argillacea MUCL 33604]